MHTQVKKSQKIKFSEAINNTISQQMLINKKIIVLGLGVTDPKGIFGTTLNLEKKFGANRVIETPNSENAMTGIAIGAAIKGLRPILTHQRVEFALLAMEQIINQAAKINFMSAGKLKVPLIIRLIIGKGWGQGPQHSQSLEVLFSHIPGLKVVSPSNAYDAKGLLISALKENNPTIFFEHRWLHDIIGTIPKKNYSIPIGKGKIVQKGKDITIVSFSEALIQVMRLKKILKSNKISAEIIDLRTLRPIDRKIILKSVKKTKKLLVIDNGWKTYGISSEIVALASESLNKIMSCSPTRLGIREIPIPSSRFLAKECYLNSSKILKAILKILGKKIDKKINKNYSNIFNLENIDIPYTDFRGPF